MPAAPVPSIDLVVGVIGAWLALGCIGLAESETRRFVARFVFPISAVAALGLAAIALRSLPDPASTLTLPLGLPGLPFSLRLDALAAFFLALLGLASFAITLFASGYFAHETPARLRLLCLQYHVFLASMALVLLADDAYLFMVAWEAMALGSYFLVTTDHRQGHVRRAGFLYVLIAHVGALAILLCFGVLHGGGGFDQYRFDAMRAADLSPAWQTIAFLLALIGFGAKAGVVPLHAWLPEAHPAAPSPVSALMSGVMLKTAIYGFIRVTWDLLGSIQWQWGLTVAIVGAATALYGILYALQQNDLKRLLAWSSVENIGVVMIGLGLAMIFFATGHPEVGAIGLIGALYHALNHSMYKSLLFLGAGAVMRSTGLRHLNDMGGLMRVMPVTATWFLVGALAISALPPLNGFVSEWLILQTALRAPELGDGVLRSLVPLIAAMLALSTALTARCFVKAFGVGFLGVPRQPERQAGAADPGLAERIGMAWLALWCVLLGVLPSLVLPVLNRVVVSLTGASLPAAAFESGWLWLVPARPEEASFAPLVFLAGIVAVVAVAYLLVRWRYHGRTRRADPWDCGYPEQTARMQDSADGFGQSVRWIFGPVYAIRRQVPKPDDPRPRFDVRVEDRLWGLLYLPVARLVDLLARRVGRLQQGRIGVYLLYSFVTLLALLVFVR